MSSLEIQNNATKGSGMLHEITEGFQTGIITHDLKRGLQSAWITTSETKSVGVDGQKINLYRESPDYGFYLKSHRRASPAPNEFHRSRNR